MNYFQRLKMVLFRPTEFFNSAKAEVGYREPLKFLIITSAIIGFLNYLAGLALEPIFRSILPNSAAQDQVSQFIFDNPVLYAALSVPMTIFGYLVGAFIGAALIHIFVRYFKGSGDYLDTFKANTYNVAPMILGFVPILGGLAASVWAVIILTTGLKTLHNLTTTKAVFSWLLPPIIIFTVVSIIFIILTSFIISTTQ